MVSNQTHITGSKEKFRQWIPEVTDNFFKYFKVDSVSIVVYNYHGDKVTFTYQKDYVVEEENV